MVTSPLFCVSAQIMQKCRVLAMILVISGYYNNYWLLVWIIYSVTDEKGKASFGNNTSIKLLLAQYHVIKNGYIVYKHLFLNETVVE